MTTSLHLPSLSSNFHAATGHIDSYYSATSKQVPHFESLTQHLEIDTCIIGGGYAGLMTAIGLIERGVNNVVVLEQNKIGWGASGRNGGFVFAGYSLGAQALVKQVGKEKARALYQLTTHAVDLIRHRINHYKIDCDLLDKGVILANWFKDQKILLDQQKFMRDVMQVDWQYLSPQELNTRIHSERYHGGLFEKNAMHFHPLNYANGIANQIIVGGGQCFEQTKVIDIDYQNAIKKVITQNGSISCKNVVIAGGGYIDKLCPPVSQSVLPIATYVMTTESLGDKLESLLSTQSAIYDTRFAFDYYRPLLDKRILWGGRISAKTASPDNLKNLLLQDLLKVFPSLEGVNIDYVWQGYMSYARHQMAQIGQIKPGVWYSIGFGGHGVGPTTAAGEIIASASANNDKSYQLFQPWGLPWNGGVFGPAAAQSSYWWYEFKDWMKESFQ
jgi:gamma-glutamylputrescine oxidase